MENLKISKNTINYFRQMGIDCINNAFSVVYLNGSMRSVTAAINKILKDNKGSRVLCMATSTIKIFDKKEAIMDACVIFDLSKMDEETVENKNTKKKKVKITELTRQFCEINEIECINYSEGCIFFFGREEPVNYAISLIDIANKGISTTHITTVRVNEEFVNTCIIYDEEYNSEEYNSNIDVQISKSINLYCNNHNVTISNNGEGLVCMTGSMRHVAATISKIIEANKGSKVKDLQTKKISNGTDQETRRDIAIIEAKVRFSYWCKKQINKNTMLRFYQHLFLNYQKQIYLFIQSNIYTNFLLIDNLQYQSLPRFLHFWFFPKYHPKI